jgi:Fic family protein
MAKATTGRYIKTTVAGEAVQAFVPDPLPPKLGAKDLGLLESRLRKAEVAIDRLRLTGEMIPSLNWFIYSFVRKEALLSSEIEGTQATLTDVFSFEQTGQSGTSSIADVEEVTNYVSAANYAFEQLNSKSGLPVSIRLLNQCHRKLMQGTRGGDKQPGEIRRSQVWLGGSRPGNAVFVPPPAEQLKELLSALELYLHKPDDLPPLLRVAAAHAQFETIHPYLDGNGRIGRLLIALLLAHWKVLESPLLYLSVFFKLHQGRYYECLGRIRTAADWAGWFRFFLEGVAEIAADATDTARDLHKLVNRDRKALLANRSMTVSAMQLFELLPEHPVISMPLITRLLSTTKPTAGKAIELLIQERILREVGERKRDRLYSYEAYVRLLSQSQV